MTPTTRPVLHLGLFVSGVFMAESAFYSVVPPLLPRIVAEIHMTTTEAGILVAAYPAGVMLAAIPAIALVSWRGVRVGTVIGLGLLTLATLAFGWSSVGIVLDLARFVQGVGGAVAWAAALAWLLSEAGATRRGTAIGGAVGAALIGMVIGPTVGAAATWLGRVPVFTAIAAVLVAMALLAPASTAGGTGWRNPVAAVGELLRARRAAIGTLAIGVVGVVNGTLASLAPLLIARRLGSAAWIAAIFVSSYLLASVWNLVLGRAADRFGRLIPLFAGFALAAVVLPLLPSLGLLPVLGVATVLGGSAASGLWTPTAAMVADEAQAAPSSQAVAVAVTNAAWAAGGTFGALVLSRIADTFGFTPPFFLAGLLCAGAAVGSLVAWRASAAEAKLGRSPRSQA